MPRTHVAGASDPWFPKHKYHGIPIYRNIAPVRDGKVHHYVGPAATVKQGIAVDLLTPEHLWASFQKEAEDVLKVDGQWIADDKERNRRINAAYARLWLADERFQWAGLAAFASKQVGCGLLHAADIAGASRSQRELVERSLGQASVPGARYGATLKQAGMELGGSEMYSRLGHGNKHLFLDIYPLHRFYMERGWKEFDAYLGRRQNKRYPVHWEVDRDVLEFGKPFREIRDGFQAIDVGHGMKSVEMLARHEQVNILQSIMYDDHVMQGLLAWNQFAWATDFPSGYYQEVKLTLSAECQARSGWTTWFSRDKCARLWVIEERMQFVLEAARRFNALLNGSQRQQVEASLREIADGGGVA